MILVSRFRSSHHCAAHSFANFGIKGTLAIYDSSAVFGFEVPTQTRGYNDRNFKSTALADVLDHHRCRVAEPSEPPAMAHRIGSAAGRAGCVAEPREEVPLRLGQEIDRAASVRARLVLERRYDCGAHAKLAQRRQRHHRMQERFIAMNFKP